MHPDEERYATEIEKSIYNVAMANQQGSYGLRYHTILVGNKEDGTCKNTCCGLAMIRRATTIPSVELVSPGFKCPGRAFSVKIA
jgi:hypothetical protein